MANKKPILKFGSGFDSPNLKKDVQELQKLLKKGGFLPENALIDGLFGHKTQRAVMTFQKQNNLVIDGVVAGQTWTYLDSYFQPQTLPLSLANSSLSTSQTTTKIKTVVMEQSSPKIDPVPVSADYNLNKLPTLKKGDGINTPELQDEVKYLQTLLKEQNFLEQSSLTDGLFWDKTDLAVKNFQASRNLLINGIVNGDIWYYLEHPEIKPESNQNIQNLEPSPVTLDHNNHEQNDQLVEPELIKITPIIETAITENASEINESPMAIIPSEQTNSYPDLKMGDGLNTPNLQSDIQYLQELLKKQEFLPLDFTIDGFFWTETETAIKQLQKKLNLAETGIVNQEIWTVLAKGFPQANLEEKLEEEKVQKPDELLTEIKEILATSEIKVEEIEIVPSSTTQTVNIDQEITPPINPPSNLSYANLQKGDGLNTPELQTEIKYLQKLLQYYGFLSQKWIADGLFWDETETAIKAFQKSRNLAETGKVDHDIWMALENKQASTEIKQEIIPNLIVIKPIIEETQEIIEPQPFSFQPSVISEEKNIENHTNTAINQHHYPTLTLGSGIDTPELKSEVKYLQQLLQEWGVLAEDIEVNGLFWHETQGAVTLFQQRNNLTANGVVDQQTWRVLEGQEIPQIMSDQSKELTEDLSRDQTQNVEINPDLIDHEDLTMIKDDEIITEGETEEVIKEEKLEEKTELLPEKIPQIVGFNIPSSPQYPTLKLRDGITTPQLKDEVKKLQILLQKLGFLSENAVIDGLFWRNTENAVKEFQKINNLKVDGIVDKPTWKALETEEVSGKKTTQVITTDPNLNIVDDINISLGQEKETIPVKPSSVIVIDQDPDLKLRDGIDTPYLKEAVKQLQTLLKEQNFLHKQTVIDGLFWKTTEDAVKAFQKSHNLKVDGVVESQTWAYLKQEKSTPKPSVIPSTKEVKITAKYPVLKLGAGVKTPELKTEVEKIQTLLKQWGFLPVNAQIDGLFESETNTAVKTFQRQNNLTPDGVISEQTWEFLDNLLSNEALVKPVLKLKDGFDFPNLKDEVKFLQSLLQEHNLINIIDGIFGQETEEAVKTFQSQNNLTADGIVEKNTWSLLTKQTVNTYFPLRQLSNLDLVKPLLQSISNSTIRRYATQSIPLILQEIQRYGITELGQIAYILATAQHESRFGQWMMEFASGQAYEGRRDLGNVNAGDGTRYKGRGFVPITGRANYTDWTRRLGVDLVNHPEKATDLAIAAKILVLGMRDGTFTGRRLSQYINSSTQDFYNARRVINGLDRASHIAGLAENFLRVL